MKKNLLDKDGLTPLHLATSICKFETFVLQFVLYFVFLFCCHKFNTHSKHDWKVEFSSFFIAICWYCQYPQFVKQLVSFSQIMGIFNTYDLLPQSYKALTSNDTFCKYWVHETENLQKYTVSITDCLRNAYV